MLYLHEEAKQSLLPNSSTCKSYDFVFVNKTGSYHKNISAIS